MRLSLDYLMAQPTDVQAHLQQLVWSATSKHVVEIGFRTGNTATAFLHSCKSLTSVDIKECDLDGFADDPKFKFVIGDSTKIKPIHCDFLFIDGNHDFEYVLSDLTRWGPHARELIGLHDTWRRKAGGVRRAVMTWLASNDQWAVIHDSQLNEGMMLLARLR